MATKPQQESTGAERADGKRGDSNATGGPELQLDQDLDSLFAEALAATEKRAARSRADPEGEEHPEPADADSQQEEEDGGRGGAAGHPHTGASTPSAEAPQEDDAHEGARETAR